MHDPARPDDARLELLEVAVEVAQRPALDRLARHAQRFPVGQLVDDATPLRADRVGRDAQVRAHLRVAELDAGGFRERDGRLVHARHAALPAASTSARCIVRIGRAVPCQDAADVHQARPVAGDQHLRAARAHGGRLVLPHRGGGVGVLDREGAPEPAALVGAREVDQLEPAHRAQEAVGPVADREAAQRVAGRVVRGARVQLGAHVLGAELVDEQLRQLEDAPAQRRDRLQQPHRRPTAAAARTYCSRIIAVHEPDGQTTTSYGSSVSTVCLTRRSASRR